MWFSENINRLAEQLNLSGLSQAELIGRAQSLVTSMDWRSFKRSDVISFIGNTQALQHYSPYQFGKFNLTLYSNDRFSIQVYFMEGIPTEIHSHAFHGYFHYLQGAVLQTQFKMSNECEVGPNVYVNKMEIESERIINEGSGEIIKPGPIHQIIRIGELSSVLMIMAKPFTPLKSELILPTGHVIKKSTPNDEFLRYMTLISSCPELTDEILPKLQLDDMLLFCFRNPYINTSTQSDLIKHLHLEIGKKIDLKKIIDEFQKLELKQKKMSSLGHNS